MADMLSLLIKSSELPVPTQVVEHGQGQKRSHQPEESEAEDHEEDEDSSYSPSSAHPTNNSANRSNGRRKGRGIGRRSANTSSSSLPGARGGFHSSAQDHLPLSTNELVRAYQSQTPSDTTADSPSQQSGLPQTSYNENSAFESLFGTGSESFSGRFTSMEATKAAGGQDRLPPTARDIYGSRNSFPFNYSGFGDPRFEPSPTGGMSSVDQFQQQQFGASPSFASTGPDALQRMFAAANSMGSDDPNLFGGGPSDGNHFDEFSYYGAGLTPFGATPGRTPGRTPGPSDPNVGQGFDSSQANSFWQNGE